MSLIKCKRWEGGRAAQGQTNDNGIRLLASLHTQHWDTPAPPLTCPLSALIIHTSPPHLTPTSNSRTGSAASLLAPSVLSALASSVERHTSNSKVAGLPISTAVLPSSGFRR